MGKPILGLIALGLAVASCSSSDGRYGPPVHETAWRVDTFGGRTPLVGMVIQIAFEDGRVLGNTGCNSFCGSHSLSEGQIEISELMQTLMACPDREGVMQQEQDFIEALQAVHRLNLTDHTLVLLSGDGSSIRLTSLRR